MRKRSGAPGHAFEMGFVFAEFSSSVFRILTCVTKDGSKRLGAGPYGFFAFTVLRKDYRHAGLAAFPFPRFGIHLRA